MKKQLLSSLLFILIFGILKAQQVSGVVINSESGSPLQNVKISAKDSGSPVFSNAEGEFTIEVSEFPVMIEFSLIGFNSETRRINQPVDNLKIYLTESISQLSTVELRSSNIPQEIRNTPASVALISESDLARNDEFNLVQSLNYVPGLYVNQGALNTNKINIRGVGSRSQYSTNRIKAYINGIPITTAEGELTLDDFDPEILERIEIFKGPGSSVYGAGLGGAINLYTKRKRGEQRSVSTDFDYGSFNTSKYGASVNYAKDSLDLFVNYTKLQSDGFRQNGNYNRVNMTGSLGFLNSSGNYWSIFYSFANLKAFIPSSLNEEDFRNDPQQAAFTWYQSAGYESYSRNILGLSYEHSFSENFRNNTAVFYNSRDGYEPRPFNILDEDRHSVGLRTRFNKDLSVFDAPAELSFGTELMWEFYEMATYQNLYEEQEERRSLQGDILSNNFQNRNYVNLFAQFNFEPLKDLHLEAGVNFNSTAYELDDRFGEDNVDQSGDYRFDPVLSPRLGASYEINAYRSVFASVSHGFSTPSVAETLTPEGLINTDLKTETGLNYEVGFKGSWFNRQLYTEVSLYSMQIENLLVARRVDQDQYIGVNAGKADRYGVELLSSFSKDLTEDLKFGLFLNSNLSRNEFDRFVDNGENYSGKEIPGSPEYMISTGTSLDFQNLGFRLNYQNFGEIPLNDANTEYTDAYDLLNLKLNYETRLWNDLELALHFGINNILNEKYAASVVTNAVGFGGAAPRYYYPGNPRNYYGGLSLRYSF